MLLIIQLYFWLLNQNSLLTEYSLLLNLPDATKVDEDSDEFQNVVQKFYETIQEYHNKIRIVQVIQKYKICAFVEQLFGLSL